MEWDKIVYAQKVPCFVLNPTTVLCDKFSGYETGVIKTVRLRICVSDLPLFICIDNVIEIGIGQNVLSIWTFTIILFQHGDTQFDQFF